MNLVLGSVQFGMEYGINNSDGIPDDYSLKKIIQKSKENNINYIDTAIEYGSAQLRLGKLDLSGFKVISKLKNLDSYNDLKKKYNKILRELNTNKIYALLFHSSSELIENPVIWTWLKKLKEIHPNLKIGYSVYTVQELSLLIGIGATPDIIQLPYNIFDREFQDKFHYIKKMNIEIHVRSVFMQGLFFCDIDHLPSNLSSLKKEIKKLHKLCRKWDTDVAHAALQFISMNKYVDGIVIGVDTCFQLEENIKYHKSPIPKGLYDAIKSKFNNLSNPKIKTNQWKKKQ